MSPDGMYPTGPSNFDAIVVGAGIVGAACAWELTARGLDVAVVEAALVGGGATAAGMGHVVAIDEPEAQLVLNRYSQTLWKELAPKLPSECQHDACGTIWVAADDQEMAEARRKHDVYEAHGIPSRILEAAELARVEPNLRGGLAGGLLVPEDSVVYPPAVACHLLDLARGPWAAIHVGIPAVEIAPRQVWLADRSLLTGRFVVNATGCAAARLTPHLAPHLAPHLPVRPKKGHLVITDRYPGFLRHQIIELGYSKSAHAGEGDSVAFNVQPRSTGQILIGSSRQPGVEDPAVDSAILGRMLERAAAFMPALAELQAVRAWTGFRAATPDNLPLIGPHPSLDGVYVATGHEGLGITTSLATAKLIASQILGEPPPIPIEPYLPARFERLGQVPEEKPTDV